MPGKLRRVRETEFVAFGTRITCERCDGSFGDPPTMYKIIMPGLVEDRDTWHLCQSCRDQLKEIIERPDDD